jgi:hypothetical protein
MSSLFDYNVFPIGSAVGQIRLLTLLESTQRNFPGNTEQDGQPSINPSIRWTSEVVSLDENPVYAALSYVWGSTSTLRPILVDKKLSYITANLEQALCSIQKTVGASFNIWVDAICINQQDNDKKTTQIQQMRRIFQAATLVFGWIGPEMDNSDEAMDILDCVGKDAIKAGILRLCPEEIDTWWDTDHNNVPHGSRKSIKDPSEHVKVSLPFQALEMFSKREYWNRAWIVQEVSTPKNLLFVCGAKQLPFRRFMAARIFLGLHFLILSSSKTLSDCLHPV